MEQPRRFQVEPPRRVVVLGNRGSGRGRVARLLAERFCLPLVEIEAEKRRFPQPDPGDLPGRAEEPGTPGATAGPALPVPPQGNWRSHVAACASAPGWVMCGNDIATFDLRVPRADWLIWVDLPLSSCALAVVRRALQGRAAAKRGLLPSLPPRWPSLRDIFNFPTEIAPRIMGVIERERRNRTIFILRSRAEIDHFLARLPEAGGFGDHRASDREPRT